MTEPRLQFSQRNRNNVRIFGEIYGYTDSIEYYVYYSFEGKVYIGGITLCKYGDRWYIHHLSSMLGNILRGRIRELD